MAVKIGHASISERGTISGKAGDQTGKEVFTRNWYKHSKGWVTLEFIDPKMGEYAAEAMEMACANPDIGYNQYENQTLWNDIKPSGWNPSKTTKKVNTDCARLIRVCVQYAVEKMGLDIIIPDFYTASEVAVLMATGLFKKHTEAKYNTQDAYLKRGMIQVTKTKGHTLMILSNGSKVNAAPISEKAYVLGERTLRNGMEGEDVKELQTLLIQMDYDLGKWGADGDFGDITEMAVKALQWANDLEVDGIVGEKTVAALLKAGNDTVVETPKQVKIEGGNCYARSEPNTGGEILGTCYRGTYYPHTGNVSDDGWLSIKYNGSDAWVSGKYAKLVK